MPPEGVVARDDLRFARRTSARSQQRRDAAIAQPALPCPAGAERGPQALVSDLQRPGAEQLAGASFLLLAGDLPRQQQQLDEANPRWLGLLGQADRQLLAWRSILVRTERLEAASEPVFRLPQMFFVIIGWQKYG